MSLLRLRRRSRISKSSRNLATECSESGASDNNDGGSAENSLSNKVKSELNISECIADENVAVAVASQPSNDDHKLSVKLNGSGNDDSVVTTSNEECEEDGENSSDSDDEDEEGINKRMLINFKFLTYIYGVDMRRLLVSL